jgi:dynein heavy chain, axonemal
MACISYDNMCERHDQGKPWPVHYRYDFTDGDLAVSLTQMQEYLDTYDKVPFKVLQFLFAEINYGGRVTDAKDRRLINHLVTQFCNSGVLDQAYSFSPSGTYTSRCELAVP